MMAATAAGATASDDRTAGAASHDPEHWHATDWYRAHRTVRRLQARIVQATQQGRWGKVTALQRLLTHSHSGKALAVRRVTENQGKNTPGVDRVRWNTPEKKAAAVRALRRRGYRPLPLRRVYVPKSTGTALRPLGIHAMTDRAMQSLYLLALDPVAEVLADPNSYGFRVARAPADAIAQCFIVLSNRFAPQWILEGDIRACFDITGASREVLEDEVKPLVDAFMRERGLELSPEKTVITHIAEGFDFLGQHVRTYDGKLLITPSKKSVKALLDKIRAGEGQQAGQDREPDPAPQQPPARLGAVSPACGQQRDVRCRRCRRLQADVALGQETPPLQGGPLGAEDLLPYPGVPPVGLLGGDCREGRSGSPRPPLLDAPRAHQAPHESATRSEPLRPSLGGIRRGAPERDHEGHLCQGTTATLLMGGATGPLPDLRPGDHDTDGVGRPPHRVALQRGQREHRELGAASSQLRQACA